MVDVDKTYIYIYILYGELLENVKNFKYLGAMLTGNGKSKKEILIKIATVTTEMLRSENIWKFIVI